MLCLVTAFPGRDRSAKQRPSPCGRDTFRFERSAVFAEEVRAGEVAFGGHSGQSGRGAKLVQNLGLLGSV